MADSASPSSTPLSRRACTPVFRASAMVLPLSMRAPSPDPAPTPTLRPAAEARTAHGAGLCRRTLLARRRPLSAPAACARPLTSPRASKNSGPPLSAAAPARQVLAPRRLAPDDHAAAVASSHDSSSRRSRAIRVLSLVDSLESVPQTRLLRLAREVKCRRQMSPCRRQQLRREALPPCALLHRVQAGSEARI